jgi:RNA polymerase sigma-70 factor (ECF subfamily)
MADRIPQANNPETNHPTMSECPPSDVASRLTHLVNEHHATLFRYAYWLTGSRQDAEDALQQTFLIAHQKMDQVRDPAATRSWLFTVLRNCFLKSKRRRPPLSFADFDIDMDCVSETIPINDDIDEEELRAAIDALPDPYKVVTLMFYFEDLSYKQIATQLEIPPGTVMSRLSRAKVHLRRALTPDRETPPPHDAGPSESLHTTTGNPN